MSAFGNILGVRASLMLGAGPVAAPAPLKAMEALEEIEIRQSIDKASGFKITLLAGREGPLSLFGNPFAADPRFERGARVVVTVWNGVKPTPIFDGLVTKTQYLPGSGDNEGRLLMLGRDLTWMMDREEKRVQHPALTPDLIVYKLVAEYTIYGVRPMPLPPGVQVPKTQVEGTPQQTCSDLAHMKKMAKTHGYRVFLDPGPLPGSSQLYFGPVPRPGLPQKPISVNLGPMSDAYDVNVDHDGERLTAARARVHDRTTGQVTPLEIPVSTSPPQSALPDTLTRIGQTRMKEMPTSGLSLVEALALLMGEVNTVSEEVVKVTGTIDNARYNAVLKPFYPVDIRGLGLMYDGTYTVAEVRHVLKPGDYKQSFRLQRDGVGPLVPAVAPEVAPV